LKEGEGGVDLRNKMFVKMCFVKGATPVKGSVCLFRREWRSLVG